MELLDPAFVVSVWKSVASVGGPHFLTGNAQKDIRADRLRRILERWNTIRPRTDAAVLAGTLWTRIVVEHPFVDCNHRTGAACAALILSAMGYELTATDEEFAAAGNSINDVRAGEEERLIRWIRGHTRLRP